MPRQRSTSYQRFVSTAKELYDLPHGEAVALYSQLKDVLGYPPDEEDAYEYADVIEALEEPEEEEEEYREPPEIAAREIEEEYEPEEEMWEEGTEFELTATTHGGTPHGR